MHKDREAKMLESTGERGIWAEHYVREFMSLPFISEFVYHSLQTIDTSQKEVADFLVFYPGAGILISQKTQKDPVGRSPEKVSSWALKQAVKAVAQLQGALRTARGKPIWCDHPRRGRVELPEGLPPIDHGIVLIEVFQSVDLNPRADELPLQYQNTPISYLSLNDFLNIAIELRTVPEIMAYLNARRSLPYTDLRIIGDERALFEFYLLNGGSLRGCAGKADAAAAVAGRQDELQRALQAKWDSDQYSGLMEDVADKLAERRRDCAQGLSPELLAMYDAPEQRSNYLILQATIANLGLRVRSELGRAFEDTITKREVLGRSLLYRAMHVDSAPEWVYVLGSSAGIAPADLERKKMPLMIGAMAHYRKTHCLLIIDRDKVGYEVGLLIYPAPPSSPTELAAGDQLFGNLRMKDAPLTLIPTE